MIFPFFFMQNINGTAECICMPRADDLPAMCEQLECVVHELLRSIYFVLESRRLDTSFEKMESPPCPVLPDEEKYRMGLENVKSKAYRWGMEDSTTLKVKVLTSLRLWKKVPTPCKIFWSKTHFGNWRSQLKNHDQLIIKNLYFFLYIYAQCTWNLKRSILITKKKVDFW